ncbi:MAG: PhoH family protein [Deltaproteobacteria bacterium]|nr:PhoH family protein [Deltaproteobacteria bacterium]
MGLRSVGAWRKPQPIPFFPSLLPVSSCSCFCSTETAPISSPVRPEASVGDGADKTLAEPSARLELVDNDGARALAGGRGEHLKLIERRLGVHVGQRGTVLLLSGAPQSVALAEKLLAQLHELVQRKYPLGLEDVEQAVKVLQADPQADLKEIFLDTIFTTNSRRPVTPKGFAQKAYIEAIRKSDIVFGLGPAGTGKTYLAMAMATAALVERRVKRIVLCRPAVEAGEKLGFLPGDLAEKVSPYLRPLYDALHDLVDVDRAADLLSRGVVEVAPLAFMRGRTLNDAFVILDEAQNTTSEQMKMFLTRLGFGSKVVITGDLTQIDLPTGRASGLNEAREILAGIEGIVFCEFTDRDVVRHPLVQEVVRAYEAKKK